MGRDSSIWEWQTRKADSPLLKRIFDIRDLLVDLSGSRQGAKMQLAQWQNGTRGCTANAYDFFRHKDTKKPWAIDVWRQFITPKHSFILWLCAKCRLLTKDRIKHIELDTTCVLCDRAPESLQHLFFGCKTSSMIWRNIKQWLGISRAMTTIKSKVPLNGSKRKQEGRGGKARPRGLPWLARSTKF